MRAVSPRERVIAAFRAQPPSSTDAKVVQALLSNPNSTSAELSAVCDWQGQAWHLHFGLMCFNRETWLWPAERAEKHDAKFYTGILATYDDFSHTFAMTSEVESAFVELGLKRKS
jgi:hypothetical protein